MQFLSRRHFDILKGIAITAVLISHIGGYSGLTWFTPLGGLGVAIFLFCSGYGLSCSYKSSGLKSYWTKKFIGVYSIYFLIELITSLFFKRTISKIILDLLLIQPAYAYGWYMQYLFGCYLVFWLVFKFIKNERLRLIILISLSVLSFFAFGTLRAEQALSFVGGVLTANIQDKETCCFKHGKAIAILALFLSLALLSIKQIPLVRQQHHYLLTLLDLLIKSLAAAGIIYLTYAMSFVNKICNAIFPFMGKISFILYLIHGYLIFIISDNVLGHYLINSLLFIVVTITTAYIANYATEKLVQALRKKLV